jgi:hypothetical protein
MSRATASISMVLGAGFSTLAATITQLTVYDGSGAGIFALLPVALGVIVTYGELRGSATDAATDDLPDGLTDHEIQKLRGDPDA